MDQLILFLAASVAPQFVKVIFDQVLKRLADSSLDQGLEPLKKILAKPLEAKKEEEKIRQAFETAGKKVLDIKHDTQIEEYVWGNAVEQVKAKPALAARLAAATIELVEEDDKRLPPDLLTELKLQSQSKQLAKLLFEFRKGVRTVERFKPLIEEVDRLDARGMLKGFYSQFAAVTAEQYEGKAIWMRPIPPDTKKIERAYLETMAKRWGVLRLEGRAREEASATKDYKQISLAQVYIALNTKTYRQVIEREEISEDDEKIAEKREPELSTLNLLRQALRAVDNENVEERDGSKIELDTLPPNLLKGFLSKGERGDRHQVSALHAVMTFANMVLLGNPGYGKSTFAQHLCLCLASARSDKQEALQWLTAADTEKWNLPAYFPLFVSLREFAASEEFLPSDAKQEGEAKHLLKYIKQSLRDEEWDATLPDHVQSLLEQGEALVIFDGLDEVTHPQRQLQPHNMPQADNDRRLQVSQAIQDFAAARFSHARIVVTCRVKQYLDASDKPLKWEVRGFPFYEIDSFNDDQIRHFIIHWYSALHERLADPDGKRDRLLNNLDQRPQVKRLAPVPIVLTQIAIVHGETDLPDSLVEVYERCAKLLLWEWERLRAKQVSREANKYLSELIPNVRLSLSEVQNALYEAVLTTHFAGEPDIREETLQDHLTRAFMLHNVDKGVATGAAIKFIQEWLRESNGLILPAGGSTFDAPHRSFREFMAAQTVVDGNSTHPAFADKRWDDELPRLVKDDLAKWGEVFRFASLLSRSFNDVANALNGLWGENDQPNGANALSLLMSGEIARDVGPAKLRAKPAHRKLYDRITFNLINLMRDSLGDYPNDSPRTPPTSPDPLPPQTRLQAGLLLDMLRWKPDDLDSFLPVGVPKFYIGKYLITNYQYARFVNSPHYADESIWKSIIGFDADEKLQKGLEVGAWNWFNENGGEKRRPRYWNDSRFGSNYDILPVVGVTWWEAAAYCVWLENYWKEYPELEKEMKEIYGGRFKVRLPHEKEWTLAAGGEEGDRFAWSKSDDVRPYANTSESKLNQTSPVGMYLAGASPCGAMDISGNAWEWQANLYQKDNASRVLRGGAWNNSRDLARVRIRDFTHPHGGWDANGFRVCALSV